MKIEVSKIAVVIVVATLLFVFLIFTIIVFFMLYQKRKNKIELERIEEKLKFEREILAVQSEIREDTMQFISQELHDNIAQSLWVTSLTLNKLENSNGIIQETQQALTHTINQVRLLSKSLNTENLLNEGLLKSLDFEIDRLKKINRWNIDYFNNLSSINLNKDRQLLLFRVFQELISNLIKYSQAQNVVIEFEEKVNIYKLSIIDDGNQYDFFENSKSLGLKNGMGLKGIFKRVEMLKGTLSAMPNKKNGMIIIVEIPQ